LENRDQAIASPGESLPDLALFAARAPHPFRHFPFLKAKIKVERKLARVETKMEKQQCQGCQ
jgi:hypothetical protein